jgi:hypothetical protein
VRDTYDGFAQKALLRSITRAILVSVLFVVLPESAAGVEYFFSPMGDDETGNGTRAAPWQTLAQANNVLRAGDAGVFLDGDYFGTLSPEHEGAPGRPITYRAANRGRPRLRGPRMLDRVRGMQHCVRIADNHYITLDGFTLDCFDEPEEKNPRLGWMWLERANHCILRNCVFRDTLGLTVRCVNCEYNRYENNRLLGQMMIHPNGMIGATFGATSAPATVCSRGIS